MTCEELHEIVNQVKENGIVSLSNEQIRELLMNCVENHDNVCDCYSNLNDELEEIW